MIEYSKINCGSQPKYHSVMGKSDADALNVWSGKGLYNNEIG